MSRELDVAEAKLTIYRSACITARQELATRKGLPPTAANRRAAAILAEAMHAAAKVDAWVPLKRVADGAIFETEYGCQLAKTCARHLAGILCISLGTGTREELGPDTLVRVLTIKEV